MAQGPQCNDERKAIAASCDKGIPAKECLAWHVHGRIPDSKMRSDGESCRVRCPNHDDHKESLVISVGNPLALVLHCHACGEDARLAVRAAVIRVYGINPKCLPMSRKERFDQDAMVDVAFTSDYTPCTRLVCVRAILDGARGPLPPAPPLIELGSRAGVSRAQAFRAAKDLRGASLDHLFVPPASGASQAPQVTPAFRRPTPVSDGDPISNGDRRQSQMETGTKPAA